MSIALNETPTGNPLGLLPLACIEQKYCSSSNVCWHRLSVLSSKSVYIPSEQYAINYSYKPFFHFLSLPLTLSLFLILSPYICVFISITIKHTSPATIDWSSPTNSLHIHYGLAETSGQHETADFPTDQPKVAAHGKKLHYEDALRCPPIKSYLEKPWVGEKSGLTPSNGVVPELPARPPRCLLYIQKILAFLNICSKMNWSWTARKKIASCFQNWPEASHIPNLAIMFDNIDLRWKPFGIIIPYSITEGGGTRTLVANKNICLNKILFLWTTHAMLRDPFLSLQ